MVRKRIAKSDVDEPVAFPGVAPKLFPQLFGSVKVKLSRGHQPLSKFTRIELRNGLIDLYVLPGNSFTTSLKWCENGLMIKSANKH